jgi:hypothetical protein
LKSAASRMESQLSQLRPKKKPNTKRTDLVPA